MLYPTSPVIDQFDRHESIDGDSLGLEEEGVGVGGGGVFIVIVGQAALARRKFRKVWDSLRFKIW